MLFEIIALILLAAATVTDIRWREVPDWLSYSGIVAGIGIRLLFSASSGNFEIILFGIYGLIIGLAIGFAMFYLGQWGGGDSKVIMALGALLGFDFSFTHDFVSLLINLAIIGSVYGILWTFGVIFVNYKVVWEKLRNKFRERTILVPQLVLVLFALASIIIGAQIPDIGLLIITLGFFLPISYLLIILFHIVETCCFIKQVKVSELTEGDWIAKDVIVKKKRLCRRKDLGITREQIKLLKKYKVRTVMIKVGMPFLPAFFLAYLATLIWGNIITAIALIV